MTRSPLVAACLLASACSAMAANPAMPNFFARRDYFGLNSEFVQVADTNGDGIPDMICVLGGGIEVVLGNGDGTFRQGPPLSHAVAELSYQFLATDLRGNGVADLVFSGQLGPPYYPPGIGVSLGNGDGTFQSGVFLQVADTSALGLAIGDFNNDGIKDVAFVGALGVWLFLGTGGGNFSPGVLAVPLSGGRNIAIADFNGDGNLDFVVGIGTGFAVVLGNGNGTFQTPKTYTQITNVVPVAAGPLTKGGPPGIAVRGNGVQGLNVYLYYGNGKGGFSGPHYVNLPGTGGTVGIAIGDLNGDGTPDLVSSSGYIAFGKSGGGFSAPVHYPVLDFASNYNVVLAKLTKSGHTDIVTDWNTANSVLLNQGKGVFEDGIWTKVSGGAGCGAAADYNGDGKPDLAVNTLTSPTGVTILLGTGNAGKPFTTGSTFPLDGAGCLVTGDLNNDGIPDLLVPANNMVYAYLGKGDGTFTPAGSTSTPSGGFVALGDFNHDGKLDFATSGNLLALGNGDGTFQTPAPFLSNPPVIFSNIAVGDINNDGWPDIILTNEDVPYANLYVLLNNQHGGFTQAPASFGNLSTSAVLTDLNGDGCLDLVVSYLPVGAAFTYAGNCTGQFTQEGAFAFPGSSTSVAAVADFNGDGIPDIALLSGVTVAIYLGTGGGTFNDLGFACLGTGPAPADLLTMNLHGQSAGLADIVVPDASGGVTALTNEGATASSRVPLCVYSTSGGTYQPRPQEAK